MRHPEIYRHIESDFMRIAKENNLNSLEKIYSNFEIVDKEFEVGVVLTPTMKLKRKNAREVYAEQIDRIYARAEEALKKTLNRS